MNRRGFTLIEMLLAASIFAGAATALGAALRAGVLTWRRTGALADAHQESRAALDQVARDLRRAVAAPGMALAGGPDALGFWIAAPGPALRRVAYGPGRSGRPERVEAARLPGADPVPLTASPAAMSFAYATADEPGTWLTAWDRPDAFPAAVRVTLLFPGGDAPAESRVVDLP